MKAKIGTGLILKDLGILSKAVPSRAIMTMLACVKMSINKNVLTLHTTDNHNHLLLVTKCESKDEFEVLIPFHDLKSLCEKVSGFITIDLQKDEVVLINDTGKNKLPLEGDPKDFPALPDVNPKITFSADGDFFYQLSNAQACRHPDQAVTHLCHPSISFDKNIVRPVGLSQEIGFYGEAFEIKNKLSSDNMIIDSFVNIVQDFQEAEISIGETHIMATSGNITAVSVMGANPFIAWRDSYPKEVKCNVTIDRKAFLNKLAIVSTTINKNTKQVTLQFSDQKMFLKATDGDLNRESDQYVPCEFKDVIPDPINFKATNLNIILGRIITENVELGIESAQRHVFIRAQGEKSFYYIMPLSLPSNK